MHVEIVNIVNFLKKVCINNVRKREKKLKREKNSGVLEFYSSKKGKKLKIEKNSQ